MTDHQFEYVSKSGKFYLLKITKHAIEQFVSRSLIKGDVNVTFENALDLMLNLWNNSVKDESNKTKTRKKNDNNTHIMYFTNQSWRFVVDSNTKTILTMELVGKLARLNNVEKYEIRKDMIKRAIQKDL